MKTAGAFLFVLFLMAVGSTAGGAPGDGDPEPPENSGTRGSWTSGLDELAGQLTARERSLDRRERSIHDREADLRAAEVRLTEKLAELTAIRTDLQAKIGVLDEQETERRMAVTKMVEQMRAKDAAPFVSALESALAVDVVSRMSTGKAGKLLAEMNPREAARLAERLSERAQVGAP